MYYYYKSIVIKIDLSNNKIFDIKNTPLTNTKLFCSFTATISCLLNNKGSKWLTFPGFMNGQCSKKYQTLNNYERSLHQSILKVLKLELSLDLLFSRVTAA